MANDDIFRIIYIILKELYEAKKAGVYVDEEAISYKRFGIPYSYYADIICTLIDKGYVNNICYKATKTGRIFSSVKEMNITLEGIEYLHENSMMKKVYQCLKDIKDLIPGA